MTTPALLRRLGETLATLVVASLVVYLLVDLLPGDAASMYLGKDGVVDPAALERLRREFGLDRPVITRYIDWVWGVMRGDLGRSFVSEMPVTDLLAPRLNSTLVLLGITLAIMLPLSIIAGVVSAVRSGSAFDVATQTFTLTVASMPSFVLGIGLVVVFAFLWPVLPAVSLSLSPSTVVLPVAVMVLGWMPFPTRMIRAGVISALRSPYAEMALLKGLPRRRRLVSHVLPNAIVPGIHAFALTAASMPAGVVVVEYLFGFQGVGVLLIDSVRARDTPTVQSLTLILVAFYLLANAMSDVATTLLNPRLRVR